MLDSEVRRYVNKEIARQLNIVLQGQTSNSNGQFEGIANLFPGMPTIPARPVMHPFGLMSSAPDDTLSVVARQGEDINNRLVLGHRDANAPVTAKGETVLYDQFGGKIQLRSAGMEFTKNDVDLVDKIIDLLTTIINARTNTMLGPQPLIPDPAGAAEGLTWEQIRQKFIDFKGGVSGS